MAREDLAARLGTRELVDEFKAIEPQLSRRRYKRLLSTALAQLLELDPDTKAGKARRWARKATGVKPSKKAWKSASAEPNVPAATVEAETVEADE
jgi:hypothetical protein